MEQFEVFPATINLLFPQLCIESSLTRIWGFIACFKVKETYLMTVLWKAADELSDRVVRARRLVTAGDDSYLHVLFYTLFAEEVLGVRRGPSN